MSPLLLTALLLFPAVLFDAAESCRRKCRIVGSLCDLRKVTCCDGLICKRLNRRYPTINYAPPLDSSSNHLRSPHLSLQSLLTMANFPISTSTTFLTGEGNYVTNHKVPLNVLW
ncbi:hypothetical protein ECG_07784 [Echinococcus granulosus]|nr:hypothetical protein ECG_07784 [Echinococcus granulosus]